MKKETYGWTKEEDVMLLSLSKTMNSIEIGRHMGIPPSTIRARCSRIGIRLDTGGKRGTKVRLINGFVTHPLEDEETLCGVDALHALNVPMNQIAEVICGQK